jgi:DegV family protein with EDD domain
MGTVLLIDSCCDLPLKFVEKNNLASIGMICTIGGRDYLDDFGKTLTYEKFYDELRKQTIATTSQINAYRFCEVFKQYVQENKSIIYIGFSSGMSGTYNNAVMAKDMILDEYENADITVIDTKSASIGQGLIIYYAVEMLQNGCNKEEIVSWIENNKMNMNHWFIVESLEHLKRGGRISSAKAAVGTLLNIKPIITIDNNGNLINFTNIRGKKRALKYLIDKFRERIENPEQMIVGISHGDCLKDALLLEKLVRDEFGVKDVIINKLGPTIGSHCGPGMLSLCFFGNRRM